MTTSGEGFQSVCAERADPSISCDSPRRAGVASLIPRASTKGGASILFGVFAACELPMLYEKHEGMLLSALDPPMGD